MTMNLSGLPAWKRLGLKLKYAKDVPGKSPVDRHSSPATENTSITSGKADLGPSVPPAKKRKIVSRLDEISGGFESGTKSSLTSVVDKSEDSSKTLKKKVSFASTTKAPSQLATSASEGVDSKSPGNLTKTSSKKSKKKSAKATRLPSRQKSDSAVEYLNQYTTAKSSWKFNKNRETWILKHVFVESDIPRDYDLALARYMYGLQGAGARERLKSQCLDLLKKETDLQNGTEALSMPEEDAQHQERFKTDMSSSPNPESMEASDPEIDAKYQSWLRKQPRAKLLMWALGGPTDRIQMNGGESTAKLGATQANGANAAGDIKVKKRKNRTVVVEYDSSSSSSSDSDSDTAVESTGSGEHGGTSNEETSSDDSDEESSSSDGINSGS